MTLDTEEQRQNLLSALPMTTIPQGTFEQVRPIVRAIEKLIDEIKTAEVQGQNPA